MLIQLKFHLIPIRDWNSYGWLWVKKWQIVEISLNPY